MELKPVLKKINTFDKLWQKNAQERGWVRVWSIPRVGTSISRDPSDIRSGSWDFCEPCNANRSRKWMQWARPSRDASLQSPLNTAKVPFNNPVPKESEFVVQIPTVKNCKFRRLHRWIFLSIYLMKEKCKRIQNTWNRTGLPHFSHVGTSTSHQSRTQTAPGRFRLSSTMNICKKVLTAHW